MNGRRSKQLRRQAAGIATDNRGLQWHGRTSYHPKASARAIYQRLKKWYARGGS